jgi:hypothetical protein
MTLEAEEKYEQGKEASSPIFEYFTTNKKGVELSHIIINGGEYNENMGWEHYWRFERRAGLEDSSDGERWDID